ncbi:MAG TPA: cytochrome C oxidase subunit IV family protein [Terriglobales bacterium]|nr:cytochrome C oxidase subunit IV family protein [Terriglobales bacterium]
MSTAERANGSLKKEIIVYVCILALSGLQIVFAYQHAHGAQLLVRMLAVALIQAGLGVMYFMHLLDERKNLRLALIPATIFVLLMMNMIWSDSFRLLHMRPFVK